MPHPSAPTIIIPQPTPRGGGGEASACRPRWGGCTWCMAGGSSSPSSPPAPTPWEAPWDAWPSAGPPNPLWVWGGGRGSKAARVALCSLHNGPGIRDGSIAPTNPSQLTLPPKDGSQLPREIRGSSISGEVCDSALFSVPREEGVLRPLSFVPFLHPGGSAPTRGARRGRRRGSTSSSR